MPPAPWSSSPLSRRAAHAHLVSRPYFCVYFCRAARSSLLGLVLSMAWRLRFSRADEIGVEHAGQPTRLEEGEVEVVKRRWTPEQEAPCTGVAGGGEVADVL